MSSTSSILRAARRDNAPLARIAESLPELDGRPIRIGFLPSLHARRGRLHSGSQAAGEPVHAACFIRRRRIVLDEQLRSSRAEMTRVILHELFHFAWVRLGNPARASYADVLRREIAAGARGELGWSAESRKRRQKDAPPSAQLWREYVCESFCDTGAWLFGGTRRHEEFTLARRYRDRRAAWFARQFGSGCVSV